MPGQVYTKAVRRFSKAPRCLEGKPGYSKTLNLPKTAFGPKIPRDKVRDQLIKATSEDLYKWQESRDSNSTNGEFILHDGPPYANGDLHMGHALNKICKDIINRFQLIYNGKKIKYQPGWDCHGLPIEMKVENQLSNAQFKDPVETRRACKEWAQAQIENQKSQFRQLAIMTDFDKPYITMQHKYEINQLRVFIKLAELGLLSQQLKPVWWGCETQTALAEAELEYNDNHKSVAIYVKFPIVSEGLKKYIPEKHQEQGKNLQFLIWTSTPWTIPANKAICANKDVMYTLITSDKEVLVVAENLADTVIELAPDSNFQKTNVQIPGSELVGEQYINPANEDNVKRPVLHGDHVVVTTGTGLVHTAPAHGRDDYLVAKHNNISLEESIVNNQGRYVEGKNSGLPPGFAKLASHKVNEVKTNMQCVEIMKLHNMIYHMNKSFKHSYPYDWRSLTPVVQRATPQWFVNVEKIKPEALKALENVEFSPAGGYSRLKAFVENRSEWCISRQRCWGVPLPIVYNIQTNEPVLDLEVLEYTVGKIAEFGTDEWFVKENDIGRWLPDKLDGTKYYKGQDTMDVWFDSGTSWSTLRNDIKECNDVDAPLADIYLEGSDQHRGWFQSSLLNKIIYSGVVRKGVDVFDAKAPFKTVITHGFITDGKGQKMSKSKGNIFSPKEAIEGCKKPLTPYLGTDGLRLWVASSNYKQDVSFNPEILNRVSDMGKKYRLTFKYILGNLYGFKEEQEKEGLASKYDLSLLDRYVLHTLYTLQQTCFDNYSEYNFSRVVSSINAHVNSVLSALYFDVSKDCLYTDASDSPRRKAIQFVLNETLKCYVLALAPIQPLLVQEVWSQHTGQEDASPFKQEQGYFKVLQKYENHELAEQFNTFFNLRDLVNKEIEMLKENKFFKNKLELELQFYIDDKSSSMHGFLKQVETYLEDLFLVSKVSLLNEPIDGDMVPIEIKGEKILLNITLSDQHKCPRCWKFIADEEETLCKKCDSVVNT